MSRKSVAVLGVGSRPIATQQLADGTEAQEIVPSHMVGDGIAEPTSKDAPMPVHAYGLGEPLTGQLTAPGPLSATPRPVKLVRVRAFAENAAPIYLGNATTATPEDGYPLYPGEWYEPRVRDLDELYWGRRDGGDALAFIAYV